MLEVEPLSPNGIVYHTDRNAVVVEVRNAMKEHREIIDVGYQTTEPEDGEALLTAIWQEANAHTGLPCEGDYLTNAWHYVIYDVSIETIDGVTRYLFTYLPSCFTTLGAAAPMPFPRERKPWYMALSVTRSTLPM